MGKVIPAFQAGMPRLESLIRGAAPWLLIYRVDEEELFLLLSRSGTHSDLF